VAGTVTVFSMMLDDAVDERLIALNPVRRRARRGRRREQSPVPAERVWATPEQIVRIADNAELLGNRCCGLLVVTAGWTGARWGELTGLRRGNTHLDNGCIVIDPDTGCLHKGANGLWLGPPKTPASARTITLPPVLSSPARVGAGYGAATSTAESSALPSTATYIGRRPRCRSSRSDDT
jgi:integrase